MGSLTTLSDIINRKTGGAGATEDLWFFRDARIGTAAAQATIAGYTSSLWLNNGAPAGAGTAPGAVAAPTRATTGALAQVNPGGGRQKWITGLVAQSSSLGMLTLYDRLLHVSGFSGTNTGAQAVGGAITRYTGAASVNNQVWIEVYTAIGATATTITMSYTDQDGNASTSPSRAIGGTNFREANRMLQMPLAAGDTGVRGVTSVTLTGTTGTVGDFGVTILRPLLTLPIDIAGGVGIRDCISSVPGPVEILTDACLAFMFLAGAADDLSIYGSLHSVEA